MSGEPPAPGPSLSLEEARERLRARGYLERGVEGAVLKTALAARTRARALVTAASLAALFLGLGLAAVEAAALASASSLPLRDVPVLFLWLLGAAAVASFLLVPLLAGLAWLRTRGATDAEAASTEIASVFGLIAGLVGAWMVGPVLAELPRAAAAGLLAAVIVAVLVAFGAARGAVLGVLLATGRAVLARRPSRAGAWALALAGAAAVGAFVLVRPARKPEGPLLVAPVERHILLLGIDGWPEGLDLELRDPPARSPGTRVVRYVKESLDPAAFWTTVATAEPVAEHGVGALDLVRLRGVRAPVRLTPGSRWLLGRVFPALGIARVESVTAAARRSQAAWEVAARGGVASLSVNWWTSFPAGRAPGTVLSNDLFLALRGGRSTQDAGWPPEAVSRAATLVRPPALPAGTAARLAEDARALDAFVLAALREEARRSRPRLTMAYLPGLDILGAAFQAPERSLSERLVLARALVEHAGELARFLGSGDELLGGDLVAVLLDGGRGIREGRLILRGPLAADPPPATVRPQDVIPTLLAALGIPASEETDGQVDRRLLVPEAATSARVASWGRHETPTGSRVDPREYVESLRSLGYLR